MIITDDTFPLYASMNYVNKSCETIEEFEEDLLRFKYIKKLFYNYKKKNILRERLILNHIVILYNVFESKACTKMLIFKLQDYLDLLYPFLIALNRLHGNYVDDINSKGNRIYFSDSPLDLEVVAALREIIKGE